MKATSNILTAWENGFKFPVMNALKNDRNFELISNLVIGLDRNLNCNLSIADLDLMVHNILEIVDGNFSSYDISDGYEQIFKNNKKHIMNYLGSYTYNNDDCFFDDITLDILANYIIAVCENILGTAITYDDFSEYYGETITLDNGEKVTALFNNKLEKAFNDYARKESKRNNESLESAKGYAFIRNVKRIPSKELTSKEVDEINRITQRDKETTNFVLYNGYVCSWGDRDGGKYFWGLVTNIDKKTKDFPTFLEYFKA